MDLDRRTIQHIAKLARLKLSDEELERYGGQLSGVLSYIDQLKEVDTEGVAPTAQVTGLVNALRDDEAVDWDREEVALAIEQAPELEGGQVKVRRVLE